MYIILLYWGEALGFLFLGSLRGEAPHKLQVGGGGGAKPSPPNAPKAPEGVQSSQGEVVRDRLLGGGVMEIEKMSRKT